MEGCMTKEGHIWFRHGWYRATAQPMRHISWIKSVNRLGQSGSRALAMGLQFNRIDYGGMEYKFLDGGKDI